MDKLELDPYPLPMTSETTQLKINLNDNIYNDLQLASLTFGISKTVIIEQALLRYLK